MSLLPRLRFGRDRETEALERRVSALQAALTRSSATAGRGTQFTRAVTAAIAALMLTCGFALGVYREPIRQSITGLARTIGLARPVPNADEPYAAYHNGDYATALRLASLLAQDEGDARAQSLLGLMHYRGQGVPRDYAEAAKWFRLAADQGDVDAQFYLGVMYSEGQGLPQDYAEGAKWFRLAADQGDAQAQYNLGIFYATQQAGKPDNVSAYMWFSLAAAHFAASDPRRSTAISARDLVANQLTQDQIAEAQRRAREWRRT
jgi:hypothetical protein